MFRKILALTGLLLAACSPGPPTPVEIEEADSCALCRMAISQRQYSAELIDSEQRVFKFDDIGCMIEFAQKHDLIAAAKSRVHIFLHDYDTRDWLKSDAVQLVRSSAIPSPMRSGLIAVSTKEKASSYASEFGGEVLTFAEACAGSR